LVQDGPVHRKTAIRRLRTIAEHCDNVNRFPDDEPVLIGAYVFGELLESSSDLDFVRMAFVLDAPAGELTWGSRPRSYGWLEHMLELNKSAVAWFWRPSVWPVWNHYIKRPLRIWSLQGTETEALDALPAGDAETYRLPAPSPDAEAEQLREELAASRAHLRHVREHYWDREWRSEHKGMGVYPENHLWSAVDGFFDLLDAVERRDH
jgi:hypothetical protein